MNTVSLRETSWASSYSANRMLASQVSGSSLWDETGKWAAVVRDCFQNHHLGRERSGGWAEVVFVVLIRLWSLPPPPVSKKTSWGPWLCLVLLMEILPGFSTAAGRNFYSTCSRSQSWTQRCPPDCSVKSQMLTTYSDDNCSFSDPLTPLLSLSSKVAQ